MSRDIFIKIQCTISTFTIDFSTIPNIKIAYYYILMITRKYVYADSKPRLYKVTHK